MRARAALLMADAEFRKLNSQLMEIQRMLEIHTVWKAAEGGLLYATPSGRVVPGRIDALQLATSDAIKGLLERDDVREVVAIVRVSGGKRNVEFKTSPNLSI